MDAERNRFGTSIGEDEVSAGTVAAAMAEAPATTRSDAGSSPASEGGPPILWRRDAGRSRRSSDDFPLLSSGMDRDHFILKTSRLTIEGRSRAGHETYFRVAELNVALDIGRCPDFLIGVPNIFITHAHLDHAVGIPFYAGQRHLHRMHGGNVHVPAETIADFRALMALHEKLEGTSYDIELHPLAAGDERSLGKMHRVRTHRATHRVTANAYEFIERRHHLRPEFSGRDGAELALLRRDGTVIEETIDVPILFYTGDTDRGLLETNRAIYDAEVVMIECSFVATGHEDRAARYRHIHFDDIAEMADRFRSEIVLLTHFSRRYSREEIRDTLRRRCPGVLRDRIRLAFPEPWQRL